jgi:type VII secretion-associated serine protease mycosin
MVAIGGLGVGLIGASTPAADAAGDADVPVRMFAIQRVGDRLEIVRFVAGSERAADKLTAAAAEGLPEAPALAAEVDTPVRSVADPLESQQWALEPASTSFRKAWNTTTGSGVIVAVVDSGVRKTHEDLAGAVLSGTDLVTGSGDGSNDQNGHGTHVAGIIAARANGKGIVGAAPGVKILPVRVLDGSGSGYSSDVAEGIIWATDHGAKVVNLSLGGGVPSDLTRIAIQYANDHGVVVVAAAGNAGQSGNAPLYPAAFDEPIAVGSISSNQQRSPFSNWGSYVDIVAPGDGIVSLWSSSDNTYAWASGTSMATPHVAAAAAMVFATNPTFTPDQVRRRLERTADDRGPVGRDVEYGAGLVDPANAAKVALPSGGDEGKGYWVVTSDGRVRTFGKAGYRGDLGGFPVGAPVVAAARTPSGKGYWLATKHGMVFAFGDARHYGHLYGRRVTSPIVAMAPSASGRGYLLVTSGGTVYPFGDATAWGSAPSNTNIRDIAMTAHARGYWLLSRDGRAYPFGDARFQSAMRGAAIGRSAVSFALSTNGRGFWVVRSNGAVASFAARSYGSLSSYTSGGTRFGTRLRSVASGSGYYVLTNDGLVYSFGSARYHGSTKVNNVTAVELLLL